MIDARPAQGHRLAFGAVVLAAALLPFACSLPAPAQDGHAKYHSYYMSWMRPHQPSTPCCSARVERDGEMQGDCAPTEAEVRPSAKPELKGQLVWWARRHDDGRWLEIPDERVVKYVNPDPTGRDAHLCESHWIEKGVDAQLIHCFKPPTGGS